MSGKRHHFIPRFLQKGFASHSIRSEYYTWVFRKDSPPFNPNLTKIGLETHFYSDVFDNSLDERITQAENKYSNLVEELIERPIGRINQYLIAEFIAHLEVRTKHLRTNVLLASDMLIDHLINHLSNEENFFEIAFNSIRNPSSPIHDDFVSALTKGEESRDDIKRGIERDPEMLMIILKVNMPSSEKIKSFLKAILPKEKISKEIKRGHNNALKKSIAPNIRIKLYSSLSYSVENFPGGNLILGDSAVLFKADGEFKTLIDKNSKIQAVYLPLTINRVLVGRGQNYNSVEFNLPEIIAKKSMDYFISRANNEEFQNLQKFIGREALLVKNDEIKEIVSNLSL